jgi:hypothetical protein
MVSEHNEHVDAAPKRSVLWKYRVCAVLAAVAAVFEVVAGVPLAWALPHQVAATQRFLDAPVCGPQDGPDCRERQSEQVWRVTDTDPSGKHLYVDVDLAVPGAPGFGQTVVLDGRGSLGTRLHPGDTVDVTSWQGKPISLSSGRLAQDTQSQPGDGQAFALAGLAALSLLLPATVLTVRRLWRGQDSVDSSYKPLLLVAGATLTALSGTQLDKMPNVYLSIALEVLLVALTWMVVRWLRLHRAGKPWASVM